ncbi:MAG: RluA family pseudouridine synthase [Streptococcaceae bacterium]|jgi:23S rRNA pseudouridine1911/1915/1917 synthase|nr:RluA family pseudouridine synthase [Streptococcaceae bacterium]
METIETFVPEIFSGLTIDELLKNWLIPRKERYLLRVERRLLVNSEFPSFSSTTHAGDRIIFQFPETESKLLSGDASLVEVLYEDQNIIVVNKPCGMKTHGNFPSEIELQNHVAAYCGRDVYVIHRLDRETSGIVLFAKNYFILPLLSELLEQRKIHREYLALVEGRIPENTFTIDKKIGRNRHDRSKRIITANGQSAVTHVKRIENFARSTLVSCQLETGRTHQIRVHLADAGHPIINDPLYNSSKTKGRMMLHANKMLLTLPFTFEKLEISSDSASFCNGLLKEK